MGAERTSKILFADPLETADGVKAETPAPNNKLILPDGQVVDSFRPQSINYLYLKLLIKAYAEETNVPYETLIESASKTNKNPRHSADMRISNCRNVLHSRSWTIELQRKKGKNGEESTYASLKKIAGPMPIKGSNQIQENPDEDQTSEQEIRPRNSRPRFPPPDPESLAIIFGKRPDSNRSPEEKAQQKAEEVQRTKSLVQTILARELILTLQDNKRIDLLGLIKTINPNQNVAVKEIIEATIKENYPEAAKRFAVAAINQTIQRWWNTTDIKGLEPIERTPAAKVLELKTQGLDIQEVLSQISDKFKPTFSRERKSLKG